jgi:hypothetical protein
MSWPGVCVDTQDVHLTGPLTFSHMSKLPFRRGRESSGVQVVRSLRSIWVDSRVKMSWPGVCVDTQDVHLTGPLTFSHMSNLPFRRGRESSGVQVVRSLRSIWVDSRVKMSWPVRVPECGYPRRSPNRPTNFLTHVQTSFSPRQRSSGVQVARSLSSIWMDFPLSVTPAQTHPSLEGSPKCLRKLDISKSHLGLGR